VRFIIFVSLIFTSCTWYIPKEVKSGRFAYVVTQAGPINCESKYPFALYSDSYGANKIFSQFIESKIGTNHFDEVDFFILWSLFQMNIRPDLTSMSSRAMLIMNYQNKGLEVVSAPNLTLKELLLTLIKRYHPKKTLRDYARILNNDLPKSIPIGDSLAEFIENSQGTLKSTPVLRNFFFRAEEVIVSGESVPRLNFVKYIQDEMKQNVQNSSREDLFEAGSTTPNIKCNFTPEDFALKTIDTLKTNSFLFKIKKSIFFAVTTQNPILIAGSEMSPFAHNLNPILLPYCVVQTATQKNILTSITGKGAHQLLMREILKNPDWTNPQKIQTWFESQRALKINAPERFIIESHKNAVETNEYLEYSKYPVYHAHQIGQVILLNQNNFWIDGRFHAHLYCKDL